MAYHIKYVLRVKHWSFRNLDSAARDYSDHLGELERKIIQIVDAALQHQLARYSSTFNIAYITIFSPFVPQQLGEETSSAKPQFQGDRKTVVKVVGSCSRCSPHSQGCSPLHLHPQSVSEQVLYFKNQCLLLTLFNPRVGDKLKQARLVPDNSPTHGLVLSELIFYRENLR